MGLTCCKKVDSIYPIHDEYKVVNILFAHHANEVSLIQDRQGRFYIYKTNNPLSSFDSDKTYHLKMSAIKYLSIELCIYNKIGKHPNVCSILDSYSSNNQVELILEYLEGGDLFRHPLFGTGNKNFVKEAIKSILQALKRLHYIGYVHYDVKLDNVIWNINDKGEYVYKLIDFNLCKKIGTPLRNQGTKEYCSPEIVRAYHIKPPNHKAELITTAIDIWAVGVITYALLQHYFPFGSHDSPNLTLNISICDYSKYGLDEIELDFISKCLQSRPEDRASIETLLAHQFLV